MKKVVMNKFFLADSKTLMTQWTQMMMRAVKRMTMLKMPILKFPSTLSLLASLHVVNLANLKPLPRVRLALLMKSTEWLKRSHVKTSSHSISVRSKTCSEKWLRKLRDSNRNLAVLNQAFNSTLTLSCRRGRTKKDMRNQFKSSKLA